MRKTFCNAAVFSLSVFKVAEMKEIMIKVTFLNIGNKTLSGIYFNFDYFIDGCSVIDPHKIDLGSPKVSVCL